MNKKLKDHGVMDAEDDSNTGDRANEMIVQGACGMKWFLRTNGFDFMDV